jgi:hypothetical protein
MEQTPIQVNEEAKKKLQSDKRRYNLKSLLAVVLFHRDRSYKYEALLREKK